MSRIGKKPITIPQGVEVVFSDSILQVKGPKGELRVKVHPLVDIEIKDTEAQVSPKDNSRFANALWGTFASHLKNMIKGVTEGFEKQLVVEGIGYKVDVSGNKIVLNVGFSHPVELEIPADLEVSVDKNTIAVKGIDKQKVGQFASEIRAVKKPEPYKGKGIRYSDEVVRRKEGKRVAS